MQFLDITNVNQTRVMHMSSLSSVFSFIYAAVIRNTEQRSCIFI